MPTDPFTVADVQSMINAITGSHKMPTNETQVRFDTAAATVFLEGFAPQWPDSALASLLAGLEADDHRMSQGSTTTPPPLMSVADWPTEAGCLVCYVGMCSGLVPGVDVNSLHGVPADARWVRPDGSTVFYSVGAVEEFFATACFDADNRMGEPGACRHLLNFWDDTPRDEARRTVAAWIRRAQVTRAADRQSAGY